MRGIRRAVWGVVLGGALYGGLVSGSTPYDRVPRGDWSYDVLARWAARGLVPRAAGGREEPAEQHAAREFSGDEPLTREAVAEIVAAVAAKPERLPAGDLPLLEHLVREYGPELRRSGRDPEALRRVVSGTAGRGAGTGAWVTGYVLGRLGHSSDDGGTVREVYRAAGLISPNPYVLGAVSLTNERELRSTDPGAFPALEHAVVRLETRFADWELGKTSRRWGPGWGGTMLLSDDAPALFQLRGEKPLSLGFLGRGYRFEQLVATLDDAGGRRYVVARRFSRAFGQRAGASISEAAISTSTKGLPLALVLPLYLWADLTFDDVRNSNDVNYIAGADIWYAPSDAVRLYGDFVLDDITAPFGWGNYSVPRKIGMLFGVHLPRLNQGRTDVRLEWAFTDGEDPGNPVQEGGTYFHRNREVSWLHDGLPLGHRMGQNRRGPFARVRHRIGQRLTLIGEWEEERQYRPTPPVGKRSRAVLYGAYDLRLDRWVALRVERTGGALGRDTLWEVQAASRF